MRKAFTILKAGIHERLAYVHKRSWHTLWLGSSLEVEKACTQNWLFTWSIVVAGKATVEADILHIRDLHTLEASILEEKFIRV